MQPSDTAAFLRCVLPAEGFYVAVIFDTPHPRPGIDLPRQIVCETIDELTRVLLANDAAGRTVYHACASFKDPRGAVDPRNGRRRLRSHANVARVKSLWLDVDAGPDKPYADAQDAARAVADFVQRVGLPSPVYVGSGSGVHVYIPLDASIPHDEFLLLGAGLKALCAQHGLEIDPTRTADASSILRPPGTHNRKNGAPTLVECGPLVDAAQLSALEFIRARDVPRTAPIERDGSIISRALGVTSYSAVWADTIADACGQLNALRNSGRLPEPAWYACLGVLSRCEDGDVKAHEWSAHDFPAYSQQETQFKLDRTRALTGATTCSKFEDLNPRVCKACSHYGRLTSPVSLGGTVAPALVETHSEIILGDEDTRVQLPLLPEPYRWSSTGQLTVLSENKSSEPIATVITDTPVFLHSVQHGELDRGNFSYSFRRYFPQDGWKDVVVDAHSVHGSNGIAGLAGRGIVVHDAKLFLTYVRMAVDEFHQNEPVQTRYDQFGWKHDDDTAFLFGDKLYTSVGPVAAVGAKEVTARTQFLGPRRNGSLAAWTDAADSLFASDMEAISAAVLASFAAPLMRFQAPNEGGAILHLYTDQSGKGKTTALQGAWTVWGEKYGLNLTNDDTRVSKPIALGVLGNLPVIYDELRDRDPEVIKRFVVMFTEGRDRMRGAADGGIRHTKATWQTVLLSAANNSLLDLLSGEGTDAPAFRVFELTANPSWSVDKARAERLKKILDDNAGHAGDAYLRYLLHPTTLAWAKAALAEWTSQIWDVTKLGTEYRFRVRLIGAIAVAAAIVNKLDILHFNTDRIVEWLIKEISHTEASMSSVATIDRAITVLGQFINEHYGETLAVPDRWKPKAPRMLPILRPHHKLTIRYEVGPARVFISAQSFRDWCIKKQISPRHILGMLKDHGVVLDTGRNVTLSAGTDIPGAQIMCIEANSQHPCMSGLVAGVHELVAANANVGTR